VTTTHDFKTKTQDDAIDGVDTILILTKRQEMYFNDVEHIVKKMNEHPVCIDTKAAIDSEEALKYNLKYWRI